jgi:hypothetical protein
MKETLPHRDPRRSGWGMELGATENAASVMRLLTAFGIRGFQLIASICSSSMGAKALRAAIRKAAAELPETPRIAKLSSWPGPPGKIEYRGD